PHPDSPEHPEPYVADPPLKKAINLAMYLRRPILLEGDAGCGKTRLASAVAYELGLPLYRWDIRSTTNAQDGLYEYDAILRLHDVQAQANLASQSEPIAPGGGQGSIDPDKDAEGNYPDSPPAQRDPSKPWHYRTFGPLGKAFKQRQCPAVVLIDEIDKADLDFPNDLLAVLDEPWEFPIKETGETIRAARDCRPIVIITSNKEKGNLPAPFLRRCLYYYVDFPNDPQRLKDIVERHYQYAEQYPSEGESVVSDAPPAPLVDNAIARFLAVWTEGGLFKKPGTSEFLDWLKALYTFEPNPYDASRLQSEEKLPYRELLFKRQEDWRKYAQ
ncbi:MAG: MoxR family ATPase, partial [Elainellaceae cyanobacterium]